MNIFKRIFVKQNEIIKEVAPNDQVNPFHEGEQIIIEKVIELLKMKPEYFSAHWYSGRTLDSSVRYKNGDILIMIDTGQILHPIEVKMTKMQKDVVKELIRPIIKKSAEYIINNITRSWQY